MTLLMAFVALPMMGQDFLNIYFKDGTFRIFHFDTLVELSTTSYDSDGMQHMDKQYQHVKTNYEEFIYDVNDIDSISFTKYDNNRVEENYTNMMTNVLPKLSDCETIHDVENKLANINASEGVEKAWVSDDLLFVKIKDWITVSFNFNKSYFVSGDSASNANLFNMMAQAKVNKIVKENGGQLKAVIAHQQYNDKSQYYVNFRAKAEKLVNYFKQAGFIRVDFIQPKLEFFYDNVDNSDAEALSIYDYDLVLLTTHGTCWEDPQLQRLGHGFLTGTQLGQYLKVSDEEPVDENPLYDEIHNNRFEMLFKDPRYQKARGHIGLTFTPEARFSWKDEDNNNHYIWYWIAYPVVHESFFEHVAKGTFSNPNSIFFNGACHSLQGLNEDEPDYTMANILMEKRELGTYLGYTQINGRGPFTGALFYETMLNGVSAKKSYDYLGRVELDDWDEDYLLHGTGTIKDEHHIEYKNEEDRKNDIIEKEFFAHLLFKQKDKDKPSFLINFPVITKEIELEDALEEFNKNGTVSVYGSRTSLLTVPNIVKCGFKLYINETNYGQTPPWTIREIDDIQGEFLSSTEGNFIGKLTGLERGKEYSYQAYVYDGEYYNYGEPCKITIEDYPSLTLSEYAITLFALTCASVQITSGSGSYSIEKIEPTGVVTASISGNILAIEAHKAGTATITVKDSKSGETANIEVTVTEEEASIETKTFTVNGVSFKMVAVEGGTVTLGDRWEVNAFSPKDVTLNSYYIGETEVSQALWEAVMGDNPSKEKGDDLPVTNVSWFDCQEFIARLNQLTGRVFRLPTDAEWEFAARGGIHSKGYKYSGSNNYNDVSWFSENSNRTIKPVLSKQPNEIGLYNMSGNVSELCNDYYQGDLSGTVNPVGPNLEWESTRVLRPSNVYNSAVPVWYRTSIYPDDTYNVVGLRLAGGGGINTISTSCPDGPHPHMIDLGLPSGTKWACCNLDAVTPESHGGYYAWGETECKDWYHTSTYSFYKHNEGYSEIGFDSDIFDTQYDTAKFRWGDSWIMPTYEQYRELYDNCSFEFTTQNGKQGCLVTGPNGASIFFPALGAYIDSPVQQDKLGFYYTSTGDTSNVAYAHTFAFEIESKEISFATMQREIGFQIRPVTHSGMARLILSSISPVDLLVGDKYNIEIISGNGDYEVICSDYAVATASISGTSITITGKSDGVVFVTVKDIVSRKTLDIKVSVYDIQPCLTCPDDHHPHMIDLGLPSGTKWACCNVGADKPEAYGGYYAWGETEEKSKYEYSNYTCKENGDIKDIGIDISGTEYDVAHVVWGGPWVMPSLDQMEELIDNCDHWLTEENGVEGFVFKGKNDGRIFMPCAGYNGRVTDSGFYWTSSRYLSDKDDAYNLRFHDYRTYTYYNARYNGYSVRPIFK